MKKTGSYIVVLLLVLAVVTGLMYALTSDSLATRLAFLRARMYYALNPPEAQAFIPTGQALLQSATPTGTATATLTPTPTIDLSMPTLTPAPSATLAPTIAPTPLPPQARLQGITHMYQMMNNCGPANLAMALTYWGWKGDQRGPAEVLKPNKQDKNIMPYEMEEYIEQHTDFQAVTRVGGDLNTLKAFLASGFPVIVEKGYEGATFDGWMGHYQVVSGYDEAAGVFIVQDSYKGANLEVSYAEMTSDWRAFNYTYLVVYPPDRRQQVLDILGLNAYDNYNTGAAERRAADEVPTLQGRDLFFALFNLGANRVARGDYAAAAQAYDSAFANYESLPQADRPWRMLWYQTGPYFAYYYTVRYVDVIALATQTLDAMSEPILEESFYWRAQAQIALGEQDLAIADLQQCLVAHPGFTPCVEALNKLGVTVKAP